MIAGEWCMLTIGVHTMIHVAWGICKATTQQTDKSSTHGVLWNAPVQTSTLFIVSLIWHATKRLFQQTSSKSVFTYRSMATITQRVKSHPSPVA